MTHAKRRRGCIPLTENRHPNYSGGHRIETFRILQITWRRKITLSLSSLNRAYVLECQMERHAPNAHELLGTEWQRTTSYMCIIYTIICRLSVSLSGDVRRLQVAILARSPREMSQTDRIVWQYILSRVRISVRPSIFLYAKNIHKLSRMPSLAHMAVE